MNAARVSPGVSTDWMFTHVPALSLRSTRSGSSVGTGITLLQGSHGWHPGPDRGSRAALRLTRDARLALQAEPGPTPPHPGAEAQGHELAGLRREPAPARQLDGLVFGRGGRGVGGRAAHEPGRAAR